MSAFVPRHGLLVVRTIGAWFATPPNGRDALLLSFDDVTALVRSSAGTPACLDERLTHDLVAAGGLVERPPSDPPDDRRATALDGPAISSARSGVSPADPVPDDAWIWPSIATVGRVTAGRVAVEGSYGRQLLLDDVDLTLLDVMDSADGSPAALIVGRARQHIGGTGDSLVDLRRRLSRLTAVGATRWYPESMPGGGSEQPSPDGHVDPRRSVSRLRHQRLPGRARLRASYRRVRPATGPADGAAEPVIDLRSSLYRENPRVGPRHDGLVPVYAPFHTNMGPGLALGMLTASARHHAGGELNRFYEIRRTEDPDSMLTDLAGRSGPAIMLCSNYVWSSTDNLALARRAKSVNPAMLFIHGGPDTPAYPDDCRRFFEDHPDVVDITVRGEGERTIVDILDALAGGLPALDLHRLDGVPGISHRDPRRGHPVTSPDRERLADLNQLPSPYLTGEFDHLKLEAFSGSVTFESNRGCPYGCTFCDWGSSTLSRIRKFDLGRVEDEMRWAGALGITSFMLADANLGIMARDVEVIDGLTAVRRAHGVPTNLGFNIAKNTSKHLLAIMDRMVEAGIAPHMSLALQSTDADTLEAIRRTNIDTDHYVALGAALRRRGSPVQGDLMLGLPGQTLDSYRRDLQFLMEHEISTRIWVTQLLPNSPMNHPDYRSQFEIVADDLRLVQSTSTFTTAERTEMIRLRHAHTVLDRFGLLRHVVRHLQWDHGVEMTAVLQRAVDVSRQDPMRYPLLNWTMRYFDRFSVPPFGWRSFMDEIRRFVVDEFEIPLSAGLETVLSLQEFLLPVTGRRFPETILLDHDYVAYQRAATASLWTTGHHTPPSRRLDDFGPARFTVYGDRMDRCGFGMIVSADPHNESVTEDFWLSGHMELDSPLVVSYADVAVSHTFVGLLEQLEHHAAAAPDVPEPVPTSVPVQLGRTAAESRPLAP
jgi:radical SAM superfamily enzyme YgiQ (UPF0313 family)